MNIYLLLTIFIVIKKELSLTRIEELSTSLHTSQTGYV